MNRERLEKIIPAKQVVIPNPSMFINTHEDYVEGYNQAREDCLSALLKAEVGAVPSVEEIKDILKKNTSVLLVRRGLLKREYQEGACVTGIDNAASAIRTLMQGDV